MAKLTKRMSIIRERLDAAKDYEVNEAITILKELGISSFIESVDVAINLGIDARKSNQNIRGATVLPHGTGRKVRVAVFTQGPEAESAKEAGADVVGMEDLADEIKKGVLDFDVVIASSSAMRVVGQLGPILGPRGLMPNVKLGTVTTSVTEAVRKVKSGQVRYRNDKNGIIHTVIGRVSFEAEKIRENLEALLSDIKRVKPSSTKGNYIKKVSISTTMGAGLSVDKATLNIQ